MISNHDLDHKCLQSRIWEWSSFLAGRAWADNHCTNYITAASVRVDKHKSSCSINTFPCCSTCSSSVHLLLSYVLQKPLRTSFYEISITGECKIEMFLSSIILLCEILVVCIWRCCYSVSELSDDVSQWCILPFCLYGSSFSKLDSSLSC